MTTLRVGDHAREIKTGLEGRVISLHDVGIQGILAIIRLDKEDPLWGTLITAFEGEVEVLGQGPDRDIDSTPGHRAEARNTKGGTTMNTEQAKTLPVGITVSRGRPGHELERGTVLENNPKVGPGFIVQWADRKEWIDHKDAKNIFVMGLRGTRHS